MMKTYISLAPWQTSSGRGSLSWSSSLGLVCCFIGDPADWEIGLGMFIVLFFGHLAQLLFPLGDSDYPGFVRLAQMASYPMLLLLPQRTQTPTVIQKQVSQRPPQERRFYNIDPHILESLLILTNEISPIETCQEICRTVSQSLLADLCLLITPTRSRR